MNQINFVERVRIRNPVLNPNPKTIKYDLLELASYCLNHEADEVELKLDGTTLRFTILTNERTINHD